MQNVSYRPNIEQKNYNRLNGVIVNNNTKKQFQQLISFEEFSSSDTDRQRNF